MSGLNTYQFARLEKAASHLDFEAMRTVLKLKELLHRNQDADRSNCCNLFTQFYRLNSSGLTDAFKQRFFELLFTFDSSCSDAYALLLLELYNYPRRQGDRALQCSFVSKLVATQDESRPIYDKHVSNFFGLTVPSAGSIEFRIAGFAENMKILRATYLEWGEDSRLQKLISRITDKFPEANHLHTVRLCDMLVWTVGTKEID